MRQTGRGSKPTWPEVSEHPKPQYSDEKRKILTRNQNRYKSKQLDLSLPFRLSGLISGAKLELVQLSRSPAVVTVALQLPESEARGLPSGRLMDKFPSNTTLWLILRKFEAGVAGGTSIRNLTARGVPATDNGNTGAGRLFYEMPVLQAPGRELSTFTDLQKSLAQLGFNGGNVLLRLSFRRIEEPLEEAMVKIKDYFTSVDDDTATTTAQTQSAPADTAPPEQNVTQPEKQQQQQPSPGPGGKTPQALSATPEQLSPPSAPSTGPAINPTAAARPVTVFSAPSSNTPQSAQVAYNENDYLPSVEHAQTHQRRLNTASRPTRLPGDKELAAKAAAEEQRLSSVKEVDVKVRLPDETQVVAKFGQPDTGKSLYDFVRSCLAEQFAREKFLLTLSPTAGGLGTGAKKKLQNTVPDSEKSLLIKDLHMIGRVLINFSWDASVSPSTRGNKASLLRPELQNQARQHKVEQPADTMEENTTATAESGLAKRQGEKSGSKRPPGSLPKWLKLPGKK